MKFLNKVQAEAKVIKLVDLLGKPEDQDRLAFFYFGLKYRLSVTCKKDHVNQLNVSVGTTGEAYALPVGDGIKFYVTVYPAEKSPIKRNLEYKNWADVKTYWE